jgi:DNA polymerase-4
MSVVHFDFPDFHASMEELRRPELKRRPLVLTEPGPRAVIQGINEIARLEGIREGMPLSLARRLCRRLLAVPPDLRFYGEQHQQIMQELDRFSPLVEGTFPGHYFVDLTGTHRLWGPPPDAACRMERRLAEQKGLHARVGLGVNKLISQVAAHCITPGDLSCIFPGGEASFLFPLPVTSLPGVGSKTASRLADFNIRQIGQLASISADALFSVFGKTGLRLLRIARGIDPNPVLPFQRIPKMCVRKDLDQDEIDRERLEAILFQLVEDAGWELRYHNRYPRRFSLEIRYADGMTVSGRRPLSPITTHVDQQLFLAVLAAFNRLVQRRIGIRRMVIELSDFGIPLRQMSLFPWEEAEIETERRLQEALDTLRLRFGRQAVLWGKSLQPPMNCKTPERT